MFWKSLRIGLVVVVALAFALSASLGQPGVPGSVLANEGPFAPDHILVKFKPGTPAAAEAAAHRQNGGAVQGVISGIDVRIVGVPVGQVRARAAAYARNPNVEYAEPDHIATAVGKPTGKPDEPSLIGPDPYFGDQWGLAQIKATDAWATATGSGIRIAILDTGIDQSHEDLAQKIVLNKNFTRGKSAEDKYGHGTHVAGIAAALTNNAVGVAGTGYNAVLMNGKVLDDNGSGYYSWISSGITWAADNGAKVINLSLGGSAGDSTLQNAVNYAWGKGVVVVAAAGNSGVNDSFYPAAYANALAVAATDSADAKASFSNWGAGWVDIAAPGVDILSTAPDHGSRIWPIAVKYGRLSGTSMATPFVAGVAALVWSSPQGTSAASVRDRLEDTADAIAGTGTDWANGRLNALSAVSAP